MVEKGTEGTPTGQRDAIGGEQQQKLINFTQNQLISPAVPDAFESPKPRRQDVVKAGDVEGRSQFGWRLEEDVNSRKLQQQM